MSILEVKDVRKTFKTKHGEVIANDDISLTIEEGQIFGLLGPNGAGKSTLINLISGIMNPDEGTISIYGKDIDKETEEAKKMMGIVPQEVVVEMAFSVEEVLYYYAGMYGVPMQDRKARIDEVLTDLDLMDKKDVRARGLSGGMKRRLMIAKAIMHKPKFLILDEPTAGVDVALRQKLWALVKRMNAEGTTILFTTHYLEEAEALCDSIMLVDHGHVIKEGKLKDIQAEFTENTIVFELYADQDDHLDGVTISGNSYHIPYTDLRKTMDQVIHHYGDNLKSIKNEAASLEEIFLKLTS